MVQLVEYDKIIRSLASWKNLAHFISYQQHGVAHERAHDGVDELLAECHLAMVMRSTVVRLLGSSTGSRMSVLMMGSRNSSGALARISSSRCRCSASRATRLATSCRDPIKEPPPMRTHGRNAFHERGMAEDKWCMRGQPHQCVDRVSTQDVVEASQHARVSEIADVLIAFLWRQCVGRRRRDGHLNGHEGAGRVAGLDAGVGPYGHLNQPRAGHRLQPVQVGKHLALQQCATKTHKPGDNKITITSIPEIAGTAPYVGSILSDLGSSGVVQNG
ncbi:hypothetical protein MSG28_010275 [Choristoneura fumiferana]|uniref:Uncharacterized protein n=1 Tax=Choristoneura fumiferana TaxID=7141 RepID=A0ACC0KJW1_CHOFU|nr:hypothetical protein MSG28_010275 [Choristoneura fumiferana]